MEYKRILIYPEYNLYFNLPEPYKTTTLEEYKGILKFISETYLKEAYSVFKEAPERVMLDELLVKIRTRLNSSIILASKNCTSQSIVVEIDDLSLTRSLMQEFIKFKDYREGTLKIIEEMRRDIKSQK